MEKEKWWKKAVVYQIYPRSFYDANFRTGRDPHVHDVPPHPLIRRIYGIYMPAFTNF